ncbi:DNA-binding transcriptional regulator, LysR family [Mameliella alba]|uniref:LysR family transcriptional regulator n=1 Tax=Mameliella alba TaxID=561184 RepID=UPI000886DEF0|nr:LysR family transcriptional regulator [Mameliella alba]PTR37378.1 DNA-binding transcriptional LysR family regulator [Mameliella alba]SDD73881.1 DNA-binding transcriptional regulator, LysR family [Mameliella alba]
MDLRHLEVFDAIMRFGSVSAAARELGITQSAVSRILGRFETRLGFDLFTRANGRLTPTRQANAVLAQARGILEAVSRLEVMSTRAAAPSPELVFVTVPSLSYGLVPSVLGAFSARKPDVRFGFDVRTTEAAIDVMVRREAEFAVVALPVSHPTLQVTPLFRTVSCAVMRHDHPLAKTSLVRPADLAGEKMIFLLRRQPTRQLIEDAFSRERLTPDIRIETSNVATACRCAAEGLGVAVVNGMMAGYTVTSELAIRPFEPRVHHTVALVEQAGRDRSPDTQTFVDCLLSEVRAKFETLGLPLEILADSAHSDPEYPFTVPS